MNFPGLNVSLCRVKVSLDAAWILIIPLMFWGIVHIYVPLIESTSNTQSWIIAGAIIVLVLASLLLHVAAHVLATKLLGGDLPDKIPIYLIAEPAQVWPAAGSYGREAISAVSGPIAQVLLAVAAFLVWNQQINSSVNAVALFLVFFNLFIAVFNFIPAFPLDGGRLLRAIFWGFLDKPARGTWLATWAGFWLIIAITFWGIVLISQQARLELQAGLIAFSQAALMAISSVAVKAPSPPFPEEEVTQKRGRGTSFGLAALSILPLAAITVGLMPINYGLYAPGVTARVEPMVRVQAEYSHFSNGSLMLTSVIPQAPIIFAEWVWGHFDNSVRLAPEEEIFPPNESVQSQAEEGHHMLIDSQTTATVVGLRLAGYPVIATSDGVYVESILSGSPADTVLKEGDVITGLNQQPVNSISDLQNLMRGQKEGAEIRLTVLRKGETLEVMVGTLPPAIVGGPVRIGIGGETNLTGFTLPFPVEITPGKIIGGPSAGLMFTLAVYDRVTPDDLTKGYRIAGTGTIDIDGNVGAIGGVQQKVAAAERAGARYFLTPMENFADASKAAKNIIVVPVKSAQDAIDFLNSLPPAG
ncbi:PDZ domain-containing protein [Dehalogenimonas etheniformans]|uniref:endopeptidase La n=1 Tax=Dehalogenimonas etheniformans TaxID=1536648 RepID=A0A2P5PAB9_9CHLR|nr:PDZ domain-containing protein [Dehalogenimonas etheniformans]PPD59215.1 PDZ domain-containing protein [Dehalogenimonas etheniformans]QNT75742.1 PDZ domain-containing protein [Dehalogenimonas etheniformans]